MINLFVFTANISVGAETLASAPSFVFSRHRRFSASFRVEQFASRVWTPVDNCCDRESCPAARQSDGHARDIRKRAQTGRLPRLRRMANSKCSRYSRRKGHSCYRRAHRGPQQKHGSQVPDEVTNAVFSFTHSSNSHDEMFVVDFNDDVSVELMKGKAFSNDPKELGEALTAVSRAGSTALYDAVSEGLHHLQYGHLGKKALVIISDGGDNASHLKYSQVLAQARQSQALIYSIGLIGSDGDEENPGLLQRLCKDTGGIAYFPRARESVTDVSAKIARDLREQYTLGYIPQNYEDTPVLFGKSK